MKAHEIMHYKDHVSGLFTVSDMLRHFGYYEEAHEIDEAAESMDVLIERLRYEAANDG